MKFNYWCYLLTREYRQRKHSIAEYPPQAWQFVILLDCIQFIYDGKVDLSNTVSAGLVSQ